MLSLIVISHRLKLWWHQLLCDTNTQDQKRISFSIDILIGSQTQEPLHFAVSFAGCLCCISDYSSGNSLGPISVSECFHPTMKCSISSACLEPRQRWYQKRYQAPGTIHNFWQWKNQKELVKQSRARQYYVVRPEESFCVTLILFSRI